MYGANVIIFEGILAFHRDDINNLLDMKVNRSTGYEGKHIYLIWRLTYLLDMKVNRSTGYEGKHIY